LSANFYIINVLYERFTTPSIVHNKFCNFFRLLFYMSTAYMIYINYLWHT